MAIRAWRLALIPALVLTSAVVQAKGLDDLKAAVTVQLRGDQDAAIRLLTQALAAPDLAPADQAVAYNDRGVAYRSKGQSDQALADFEAAIRVQPDDADGYLNRGLAYRDKGQADQATADIDKARQLQPGLTATYFNHATKFHFDRQYEQEIAAMDKVIALTPDDPVAYNARGGAQAMAGHIDRALADYEASIRLKPNYAEAYNNRGLLHEDQGRYDLAVADFDMLIKLKSNFPPAYEARGLGRFALGDFKGAAGDFEKGLKLDPSVDMYRVLWLHLARARMGKADPDELSRNAAMFRGQKWPSPVVALFLGKMTPAELHAASVEGDPEDLPGQSCDAVFYTGEYELLHKAASTAKKELEQAVKSCSSDSFERMGAVAELKRTP
jgi:lipoprotein NlpI